MPCKTKFWGLQPPTGQLLRLRSRGSSMIPALREGDVVTVIAQKRCRIGDIILFRQGDSLVMHRVVAKSASRIITKGDALGRLDEPITSQDIWGFAVSVESHGKTYQLNSLASRFVGLAFSLTIPLIPKSLSILVAVKHFGWNKLRSGYGFAVNHVKEK
jgi:hypothetical protein